MPVRSLHLLFAASLLIFAADASLHRAVARTTHAKKHHAESKKHEEPGGPALVVRGDIVTSRALVDGIASAYEDAGKGNVEVQPFNTVSGIDAALNGSADIAASARAGFQGRAQEAGLTFTPVAWDALVMITSPDNPVNNITLKQLHDVYYGQITNWQQLGGKDEPIDLYTVASPLDGAEYSLRRLLYGSGNAPVVMPRMYINVSMLEQGVAIDPKALGLSTLSGVHGNKEVKIIPIEGVMPSQATVADGSYPLYTAIYLASSPSSPHAAQIAQFMAFLSDDAAKNVMREHDLLPYADAPTLAAQTPDQQLAAVSAKMVGEGLPPPRTPAPLSAPGATYSHLVSVAPGSEATARARMEMMQARADQQAAAAPSPDANTAQNAMAGDAQATANAAGAVVTASAKPAAGDPALKKAENVAPSNPVVVSANGAVAPAQPQPGGDHPASYTVVKGDTLSKISRKYSVSVDDLRNWNGLKGDELRVGQVLQLAAAH